MPIDMDIERQKLKRFDEASESYVKDAIEYAKKVNNVVEGLNLELVIQDINTHKYDSIPNLLFGAASLAVSIAGGGILGQTIVKIMKKIWDATQVAMNGSKRVKGEFAIALTTDIAGAIISLDESANVNTGPAYTDMVIIEGFVNSRKSGGGIKTDKQKIQVIKDHPDEFGNYFIDRSIRRVRIAHFQLKEMMRGPSIYSLWGTTRFTRKPEYNLFYIAISSLIGGVEININHAGTQHRQILERWFMDYDEYKFGGVDEQDENKRVNARGAKDRRMHSRLVASRQFGLIFLAKNTNYNRKFIKLAIAVNSYQAGAYRTHRSGWYGRDQWTSNTIFRDRIATVHNCSFGNYTIAQVPTIYSDRAYFSPEHALVKISRSTYFKLIDIKCCLWGYMSDYTTYFKTRLKGQAGENIAKYLRINELVGQGEINLRWEKRVVNTSSGTLKWRTCDLASMYLLLKIPEIILGEPISGYIIGGDQDLSEHGSSFIDGDPSYGKLISAIYLAIHGVIYFYIEEKSKGTGPGRARIDEKNLSDAKLYAHCILDKLSSIIFAPFYRLSHKNEALVSSHNAFIPQERLEITITKMLDENQNYSLSHFASATTPIDKGLTSNDVTVLNNSSKEVLLRCCATYFKFAADYDPHPVARDLSKSVGGGGCKRDTD